MYALKTFLKRAFVPVTILLVPHARSRPLSVRLPLAAIVASLLLAAAGTAYVGKVSVQAVEYYRMKERLAEVTTHFLELKSTMRSLKEAEEDFRRLFSLKTRKEVFEAMDGEEPGGQGAPDTGSVDTETLREEVRGATASVEEIRRYLSEQRDLYLATPLGRPVDGWISSGYGYRAHPKGGYRSFHGGVDLSISEGTEVRATADGVVSFAGYTRNSGHAVVIEHGHGFSTAYAHNQRNVVRVGQRVARGAVVALAGSTGRSTGPHVHYEIWKDGREVDPSKYLKER